MSEKAYSGDLIEVTKAFDEPYKIGDILEVDCRQSDMGACDDDCLMTTEGYALMDGDYKIFKRKIERKEMSEEDKLRQLLHNTIDVMSFEQCKQLAKFLNFNNEFDA